MSNSPPSTACCLVYCVRTIIVNPRLSTAIIPIPIRLRLSVLITGKSEWGSMSTRWSKGQAVISWGHSGSWGTVRGQQEISKQKLDKGAGICLLWILYLWSFNVGCVLQSCRSSRSNPNHAAAIPSQPSKTDTGTPRPILLANCYYTFVI